MTHKAILIRLSEREVYDENQKNDNQKIPKVFECNISMFHLVKINSRLKYFNI